MIPNVEQVYNKATIAIQLRKYNVAEQLLQELLTQNPNDSWVYILMGAIWYNRCDYGHAIEFIKQAIALDTSCPDYYRVYCSCLNASGEYQEALSVSDEGLMLDPTHVRLMYERALALKALGKLDRAEDVTKYLLKKDPNNDSNHNLLATIYAEKSQLDEANLEFLKALELNPNNSGTYNSYAMMKFNKEENKEDESIEMLQESLRLNPENKTVQKNLEYVINYKKRKPFNNFIFIILCCLFVILGISIFGYYIYDLIAIQKMPITHVIICLVIGVIWQIIEYYLKSRKKQESTASNN